MVASIGFDAFWKAFKYGVLIFCGFGPVRRTLLDNIVKETKPKVFECWLKKAYKPGQKAK